MTDERRDAIPRPTRNFIGGKISRSKCDGDRFDARPRESTAANLRFCSFQFRLHSRVVKLSDDFLRPPLQFGNGESEKVRNWHGIVRITEVKLGCCLKRSENQLVAPKSAEKRFAFQRRNQSLFSGDNAGLRSAEKFIAAEADKIDSGTQSFHRSWFMFAQTKFFAGSDRAAADVFDNRNFFCSGQLRQFSG